VGARTLVVTTPPGREGTLWLDQREEPGLPPAEQGVRRGLRGYRLPAGGRVELRLRVT
jgi:hypothetical protein